MAMKTLTITQATFENMISGLIASGVTFDAVELPDNRIKITFTGGY